MSRNDATVIHIFLPGYSISLHVPSCVYKFSFAQINNCLGNRLIRRSLEINTICDVELFGLNVNIHNLPMLSGIPRKITFYCVIQMSDMLTIFGAVSKQNNAKIK